MAAKKKESYSDWRKRLLGFKAKMQPKKRAKRKNAAAKKSKPKSVFVRNFTGRISQNKDKTISVVGSGHRGRKAAKR